MSPTEYFTEPSGWTCPSALHSLGIKIHSRYQNGALVTFYVCLRHDAATKILFNFSTFKLCSRGPYTSFPTSFHLFSNILSPEILSNAPLYHLSNIFTTTSVPISTSFPTSFLTYHLTHLSFYSRGILRSPALYSELNNAAPNSSPSHCTMVVDLPQMPLQAYLPDHPLPMDSESASGLERSLPSSTLPESRETRPPETSSSPSAVRIPYVSRQSSPQV